MDFEFSVSATTRKPRPGEVDGVDYMFVSKDEFEDLIGEGRLIEWAVYNHNYYGTPADPIDDALRRGVNVLLDIEIQGARQIRQARPDALMIFIEPPSLEELERRLRARGDTSEEDIADRVGVASSQMAEAETLFDHSIVNEDLQRATREVADLIIRHS